jgi:hypothetical protein
MEWNWWVAQVFAVIGIVFIVTSMQMKTRKAIVWHRAVAGMALAVHNIFLFVIPAIILSVIIVLRTILTVSLVYKTNTKNSTKVIWCVFLFALCITLNAIFWQGVSSAIGMTVSCLYVLAYVLSKPFHIRIVSCLGDSVALIFFAIIFSPALLVKNVLGVSSSIVGIVRHDIRKKSVPQSEEAPVVPNATAEIQQNPAQ